MQETAIELVIFKKEQFEDFSGSSSSLKYVEKSAFKYKKNFHIMWAQRNTIDFFQVRNFSAESFYFITKILIDE